MNFRQPIRILAVVFCAAVLAQPVNGQNNELNQVDKPKRTLIAASNMLHPPFSSWAEGQRAAGIEVDIVNAAASALDSEVKWIEKPFGELIGAVATGEIDIAVSTIGITEERKQKVAFSNQYYATKIVALVSPGSKFDSLQSLKQSRIGADKSTTSYTAAKSRWPNATIVGEVKEGMKWPEMIEAGMIDAFVVDASDQSRLESQSAVKLFQISEPISSELFAVVVNKRADRLRAAINEQIKQQRAMIELRIGGEYQFTTPIGQKLASLEAPADKLISNYVKARADYRARPNDADALIWYGRRAGYLFKLNEAIQIFRSASKNILATRASTGIEDTATSQSESSTTRLLTLKKR